MAAKVNIGNRIYFPKNGRFYGTFYGKKFLLLYYFNHNFEDLFENDTEALKSSKESKYSIIGELSDYFKINDKFEFVLWYPTFKNHWRQSINPVYEKETNSDHDKNATGYEPLHIESTVNYWGGLVYCSLKHAKGSQGALLDGSTYHVNWYSPRNEFIHFTKTIKDFVKSDRCFSIFARAFRKMDRHFRKREKYFVKNEKCLSF